MGICYWLRDKLLYKMASDDVLLNISTRYLDQNNGENDVNSCEKCFKMKDDLKVILN